MDDRERERLGRIAYDAAVEQNIGRGYSMRLWDTAEEYTRELHRVAAQAVAVAVLPPGMVPMKCDQAERLTALAKAADTYERFLDDSDFDTFRDAVHALQRGDLDPLHPAAPDRDGG